MSAAIEVRDLAVGWGDGLFMDGLNLTLEGGLMAAVLGPNGAGKSTLLRALSGLQPLRRGTIRLLGRDLRTMPAVERARCVAVVPQEISVPVPYTVEEIVMLGRTARLPPWRAPGPEHWRAVEVAMAQMDVLHLRHRYYNELSGGERQRTIIAMALAQEPELLLLDEPTAHLDLAHRVEILALIRRLNRTRGLTVVMASHDLNLVAQWAHRIYLLDAGRLIAEGSPEEVLQEDRLRSVYRCELRVARDEEGILWVRPPRIP